MGPLRPARRGRRTLAGGPDSWPRAAAALAVSAALAHVLLRPRGGPVEADAVRAEGLFDPGEIARARAYGRAQLLLGAASSAAEAATLLALSRRRRSHRAPERTAHALRRRRRASSGRALTDARRGGAISLGLVVVSLPFGAEAHRRARNVGLATQDWRAWGLDTAKAVAIGGAVSAGASAAVCALVRRQPDRWWLTVSGAGVIAGAAATFIAPIALDPVFHDFQPLPEDTLRREVYDLADRAGVRVREVYEVDASRRTTAANAYVTGFGPTKRVVLFDTLLAQFTREEAQVVVAHELAHVRHRDVARGIAQLAILAPAAMYAAAVGAGRLAGSGSEPEMAMLAGLSVTLGGVGALLGVTSGSLARAMERRADAFSLSLTDAPAAFVSFQRKIVTQNLADPDPPAWRVLLGASHPTTLQRIGIARAYERRRAATGDG